MDSLVTGNETLLKTGRCDFDTALTPAWPRRLCLLEVTFRKVNQLHFYDFSAKCRGIPIQGINEMKGNGGEG